MELTKKQEDGLRIAVERYKNGEKYTVIAGYAGVGKSTLVKFIISAIDIDPAKVCYATFTGKAAEVLRKKGNPNACTMHHLLYKHIPKKEGGFMRIPKETLDYEIVVIDEVSMPPKDMMELLFCHDVYVICLGDPFQLPPIEKDKDNHLLDSPHIFLDEIMRQAKESEIIRLTMDIRDEKPLSLFDGKEVKVYEKKNLVTGMLTWADQVLVAKNVTRNSFNTQIRSILGKGPEPEDGDKIVFLRNYWDDFSQIDNNPIVNGATGYLQLPKERTIIIPKWLPVSTRSYDILEANVVTDDGDYFEHVKCDLNMIKTGEATLSYKDSYLIGKKKKYLGDVVPKEMTYGYALTGHKAQGSEWDKVLVVEENFPFEKTEHARWLYTCATRASKQLIIIKD